MLTTKKISLVLSLLCLTVVLSACSSMAIPSIILRRWNDVGVTYVCSPSQAETAVVNAISEMGCQVRYIQRTTTKSNGSYFSQAGSMTVNAICPQNSEITRHFVVDIDRVAGHRDWCKIRIGIGDFGHNDMAIKFHRIIMRSLNYVPERMPSSNKDKLVGAEYEYVTPSSDSDTVIKDGYIIEPAK